LTGVEIIHEEGKRQAGMQVRRKNLMVVCKSPKLDDITEADGYKSASEEEDRGSRGGAKRDTKGPMRAGAEDVVRFLTFSVVLRSVDRSYSCSFKVPSNVKHKQRRRSSFNSTETLLLSIKYLPDEQMPPKMRNTLDPRYV
jgi:hypothetical protein